MWTDANVSMRSAKVILKHLHAKLGLTIQVPMTEVTKLGKISDDIEPVFGSYCCKENNDDSDQTEKSDEVITENVSFWSYDFCDLMELDFEQLLKDQEQDVKYGYSCKKIPTQSVHCILGADHGGGKSHYLLKTNYLLSQERHLKDHISYGSHLLQFAEISCKKDTAEIQKLMNQSIL